MATYRSALAIAMLLAVLAASCTFGSTPPVVIPPTGPPPIPDAQAAVNAPLFIGQNAFPNLLGRHAADSPTLSTVRADGANTGVADTPAPLGKSPATDSEQVPVTVPLIWDRRGGLTAGCQVEFVPDIVRPCLATVDPATFAITARWLPPTQDLNLASTVVDDQQRVLVSTDQGHVFVLQHPEVGGAVFHLLRDIDLSAAIGSNEALSWIRPDDDGNIWFTTRAAPGLASAVTTTTVGYVTPGGQIVTIQLANQMVESSFAIGHDNVFVVTSPAGAADHPAATGFVYNLVAGAGQIQTVWRATYDAGQGRKPGGLNRGSGAAVVLLDDKYVAVVDNADPQVDLVVYSQAVAPADVAAAPPDVAPAPSTASPRVVCKVPLFAPGASAVTSDLIGYQSAGVASVVVANGFNAPVANPADINGPGNNMNQMAPGLTRVDVTPDGSGCTMAWSVPLRFKAALVLSTVTGLAYGYSQDEQRASAGSYIWYFVAVDYASGRVAWRQRAGAGGSKNNNLAPLSLSQGGTLYQSLPAGVVWMRDIGQQP